MHKQRFIGKVVHGRQEGRMMGFPTANVRIQGDLEAGVYSGKAIVLGKEYKAGIMYKEHTDVLEAHILDFDGDIYDKEIELELGKKIREVIKFDTKEELIDQIRKDVETIRKM